MTRVVALVVAVFLLVLMAPANPVGITGPSIVTDGQTPAPRWLVRVDKHTDNRRVYFLLMDEDVAPDRDDAWRRSHEDLDGEAAPKFRYVSWATLPSGEFRLWAVLHTQTGEVARASVPVSVISRF